MPWRFGANGLEILMITSRETRRWVIPKGGRMAGKTDPQAAGVEAMEEAGVQGEIDTNAIGMFRYAKRLKNGDERMCIVSVFPLRVLIQLGSWPEMAERARRWMGIEDAAASVMEPDLADLIRTFGTADLDV